MLRLNKVMLLVLLPVLFINSCVNRERIPDLVRLQQTIIPDLKSEGILIPDAYEVAWGYTPQQEVDEFYWSYILKVPEKTFKIPNAFFRPSSEDKSNKEIENNLNISLDSVARVKVYSFDREFALLSGKGTAYYTIKVILYKGSYIIRIDNSLSMPGYR